MKTGCRKTLCALALLALPAGLAWRQTRVEAIRADEHGYAFTKGGRRLASTQIENVALLGNEKKFSRLATLAEFSTQLLLREGCSRVRILDLNREIKRETYNRHYDTELYRQKLKLPVRSEPELARFVNESYDAISSPDLVRIRILPSGLIPSAASARVAVALRSRAYLPVVVASELDRQVRVTLGVDKLGAGREVDLEPRETRGIFVALESRTAGEVDARLAVAEGDRQVALDVALDVRPVGTLRVDLLDEKGTPTAARVTIRDSTGLSRAPDETFLRLVTGDYNHPFGGFSYFHADSSFELRVPEGKTTIEVSKGFEYRFERREIDVARDDSTHVALRLQRVSDVKGSGWFSGETHIHANALSRPVILPEDAWLQIRAEDLNVGNLLVNNTVEGTVHDREYFTGQAHPLSRGDYILYWNEEMRNFNLYGHMGFLKLKELVEPLYTGFPGTGQWEDYPANYVLAARARAQGAAITQVHPSPGLGENVEEYPVDVALGMMDALDVMSQYRFEQTVEVWHRLLNCGFRCAISAGTDTFNNNMYALVIGSNRVYARVTPPLTYEKWIDAFKQGRSFATNGPLLSLTINGAEPGEEVRLQAGPTSVQVQARAFSLAPMDRLDVLANGEVVHSVTAAGDRSKLEASCKITLRNSAWVAVRVTGPAHRLVPNGLQLYAHTSPVYCLLGDRKIASTADAKFFIDWINRLIAKVRSTGAFSSSARREEVIRLFEQGRSVYERMAQGQQGSVD